MVVTRRVLLGGAAGALAGCAPGAVEGPSGAATSGPASPSGTPSGAPSMTDLPTPVLRLAAASDLHYGEHGTDYDQFATELIERLNAQHAATPLDLVVLNGDLAHEAEWLAPLRDLLKGVQPRLLPVQGNHDGATEQQWRDLWGHGFNHTVSANGVRIIAAGTSNAAGDYLCADGAWLTEQLDAAGDAPVIVAFHITPRTWTKWGIDCPATVELLGRYRNVAAVLNGHDHDEAGVKTAEGVPYLFDGHAGGHWGTTFRGFRVVELYPDGRIETWVTDGTSVHGSDSLPPRR
ncbi:metallophosphoesterase family protein [Micropruina sp.]|uniref:metallophosphoesterase family protein n=1 Tax=Micropruina sp. TaxID=2737536 RepID=UPI0039E643EE